MKSRKTILGILGISLAVAVHGQTQTFLTNGLVAYYPFSGNAQDASGGGNNGIVNGATLTEDRFGAPASAYNVGPSQYIYCKDAPQLDFGAQTSFAVFAWIKFSGYVTGFQGIVSKMYDDSNPTSGFQFGIFQNSVQAQMGPPLALTFRGSLTINDGKWHAVGLQRTGIIAELFIDGRREAAASDPTLVPQDMTCTNFLLLGVERNLSRFFPGSIDDVRIYNRALSETEVQQLYQYELNEAPIVEIRKAVYIGSQNLKVGTNYQLQVSTDLKTWTNTGPPFTATNTSMLYPQYWNVDNWDDLFFRLQWAP
jgi:concanavalin A-like lectin/glucanase superfamily protein